MYQFGWNGEVSLEGGNPWAPNQAPLVENRWIAGDYFKTMGIAVVRGRPFDARDRDGAMKVADCLGARRREVLAWARIPSAIG